jgi:hypothetical protein
MMVQCWSWTVVNAAQYKAAEAAVVKQAAVILALNDNAESSLPAPSDSNSAMILPAGEVCCSHFVDEVTHRGVIYHSISCIDDCTWLCSCQILTNNIVSQDNLGHRSSSVNGRKACADTVHCSPFVINRREESSNTTIYHSTIVTDRKPCSETQSHDPVHHIPLTGNHPTAFKVDDTLSLSISESCSPSSTETSYITAAQEDMHVIQKGELATVFDIAAICEEEEDIEDDPLDDYKDLQEFSASPMDCVVSHGTTFTMTPSTPLTRGATARRWNGTFPETPVTKSSSSCSSPSSVDESQMSISSVCATPSPLSSLCTMGLASPLSDGGYAIACDMLHVHVMHMPSSITMSVNCPVVSRNIEVKISWTEVSLLPFLLSLCIDI